MDNNDKQYKVIKSILNDIAIENSIRLLYACGGGSREWGFASEFSDYDVYFLYVHPKDRYLRLDSPQDTIERKISAKETDIGIAGWDIYKALRLLRKSNPPLLEQLFSTTIYAENTIHIETLRNIARRTYSSKAVFYHYSRMAHRNYRQYIKNKIDEGINDVPQKKYLYVVRPIVALLYLEQHKTLPPTNFLKTLEAVTLQPDVRRSILDLVSKKMAGHELTMGTPDPILNSFAEQHLTRWLEHSPDEDNAKHRFQELDDIVLAILEEQ